MAKPKNFEEFVEDIKHMVEFIGTTLPPDGDWFPMLVGLSKKDKPAIVPLMLPKEDYGPALAILIREMQLKWACLVLSSWQGGPDSTMQPSLDPNHREVLMLPGSDGVQEVWWQAPILRSRMMVTLGEWESTEVVSGNFAGLLTKAFRGADLIDKLTSDDI